MSDELRDCLLLVTFFLVLVNGCENRILLNRVDRKFDGLYGNPTAPTPSHPEDDRGPAKSWAQTGITYETAQHSTPNTPDKP
jgi:hypothetical protein